MGRAATACPPWLQSGRSGHKGPSKGRGHADLRLVVLLVLLTWRLMIETRRDVATFHFIRPRQQNHLRRFPLTSASLIGWFSLLDAHLHLAPDRCSSLCSFHIKQQAAHQACPRPARQQPSVSSDQHESRSSPERSTSRRGLSRARSTVGPATLPLERGRCIIKRRGSFVGLS